MEEMEKDEIHKENETDRSPDTASVTDETENAEEESADKTPMSPKEIVRKCTADVFDVIELFVFCATVILLVFTFILRPTVVQGGSMEDTLLAGDYLIVTECGYKPQCGDIVVAQNTSLPLHPEPIIKRVIATGGQTVDIDFATWTVTVDGVEIDESYRKLTAGIQRTSDFRFPITVPEGYVFVMGDNRNHSADSRSADIGLMDERCIVGRAALRVFPLSRFDVFD